MPRYNPKSVEPKWQAYWDQHQTFATFAKPKKDNNGKLYVLDMFPYPSGSGLHVGHPEGYTATDIVCRYSRMKGKHVLHPMGWDAFGLPAEQHAINTGTHPRVTTYENIATFKRQLKSLGFSYDWNRELSTTDPDYFRWTQWIFLKLYDTWYDPTFTWTGPDGLQRTGKGRPIAELPIPEEVTAQGTEAVRRYQDENRLAYQSFAPVNWCPELGTVLANEEVTADGRSDRGNFPVERRPLRQWMLRITAYAERLINELEPLDWPESVKSLQRNWIGRSIGAEVDFPLAPRRAGGVNPLSSADLEKDFHLFKSTRSETGFPASPSQNVLRVYTTRPDTLFGATYMVIAPEHLLIDELTTVDQKPAVETYRQQAALKSDLDRTDLAKTKTGVFTGSYAINPVNGQPIPIWVADYVLSTYGTGAIMAVPAHDSRDLEFAHAFKLPVVPVVQPPDNSDPIGFTADGFAINSGEFTGLPTAEVKTKITAWLAESGLGRQAINYRLRDWLFSRQRYWGEPFPLWHELDDHGNPTGLIRTVPLDQLPVVPPDMDDFKPKGTPDPPLSWAPQEWLYRTDTDGVKLVRETNSMPQWAGSCWYYIRFADNKNPDHFIDPELEKYWLPVDLYIGGAEHAVLHLLYSRFWHKVLFDLGYLSRPEPFQKLVNQGMILGEASYFTYAPEKFTGHALNDPVAAGLVSSEFAKFAATDDESNNIYEDTRNGAKLIEVELPKEKIEPRGGKQYIIGTDLQVTIRSEKMSKSRGNVINPDDVVEQYGADALRLYEMFMGPLDATKPWQMNGVEGVYRFLARAWRMITDENLADEVKINPAIEDVPMTEAQERLLHKTIKAVTNDIESLSLNTAISRLMEFTNEFASAQPRPKAAMEIFVLLLSPYAPHLAEDLWQTLGYPNSLAYHPWPTFDDSKLIESELEIPVQINGKLRAKIKIAATASKEEMEAAAKADPQIIAQLEGKTIVKTVLVAGKMVNFVVK
jgi:leucyl-tRNA synthetase